MSQEVKASVAITNIQALERAVEKARARGHNLTLEKNSTARMWNGRPKHAAYVVKLHDKEFDVAVNESKTKDGKVQYHLSFDDWNGQVFSVLGKEIEGISHGLGHARNKPGSQFTVEELTLSNVNLLLTDYYTEMLKQDVNSCGYMIGAEYEAEQQKILEITV